MAFRCNPDPVEPYLGIFRRPGAGARRVATRSTASLCSRADLSRAIFCNREAVSASMISRAARSVTSARVSGRLSLKAALEELIGGRLFGTGITVRIGDAALILIAHDVNVRREAGMLARLICVNVDVGIPIEIPR